MLAVEDRRAHDGVAAQRCHGRAESFYVEVVSPADVTVELEEGHAVYPAQGLSGLASAQVGALRRGERTPLPVTRGGVRSRAEGVGVRGVDIVVIQ